jgi:hypothetical protein
VTKDNTGWMGPAQEDRRRALWEMYVRATKGLYEHSRQTPGRQSEREKIACLRNRYLIMALESSSICHNTSCTFIILHEHADTTPVTPLISHLATKLHRTCHPYASPTATRKQNVQSACPRKPKARERQVNILTWRAWQPRCTVML